jgi:hypothetical protein
MTAARPFVKLSTILGDVRFCFGGYGSRHRPWPWILRLWRRIVDRLPGRHVGGLRDRNVRWERLMRRDRRLGQRIVVRTMRIERLPRCTTGPSIR